MVSTPEGLKGVKVGAAVKSTEGSIVCVLACICGLSCTDDGSLSLKDAEGKTIVEDKDNLMTGSVLKYLARGLGGDWLGSGAEEEAQVEGWLSTALGKSGSDASDLEKFIPGLDEQLTLRSFLAGARFTLADFVLYLVLASKLGTSENLAKLAGSDNFIRWYDQCQHDVQVLSAAFECTHGVKPSVVPLGLHKPLFLPAPSAPPVPSAAAAAGKSEGGKQGGDAGGGKGKGGKAGAATTPAPAAAAAAVGGAAAVAAGAKADGGKEGKKAKKEKKPAAPAAAPAAGDEIDITKLDLRVGKIVKIWPHEEREKLYCENIDLGEGEGKLRNIASGLRDFYTEASLLEGKLVVVVSNLKGRNMAGFKSEGMVMCASNADHTKVAIVEPPAGAKPGDKITFAGKEGEPATPAQVERKKMLEKLFPLLKTDGDGVPCFDGIKFEVKDVGACSSPLPGASVA